jgi:hypothetical protein
MERSTLDATPEPDDDIINFCTGTDHDHLSSYVKYHDDDTAEFVYYSATLNDYDGPCRDDDCSREHVYIFTADQLAARDAAQYDAGYQAAWDGTA